MKTGEKSQEFAESPFAESSLPASPFPLFTQWLSAAAKSEPWQAAAMSLSTLGEKGAPSCRIVLLRGVDDQGFCFFTNYRSRKGRELGMHPQAAATFWWPSVVRQVRVEGRVEKLADDVSDVYFATRPRESQIGAWASPQSEQIESREWLMARFADESAKREGQEVPRPAHWGGYRLVPLRVEFWQGGAHRLHDRIEYCRDDDSAGEWCHHRLAP